MRLSHVIVASLFVLGCADSTADITADESPGPVRVTNQPLLDQAGPNWLVAGGPGLVEMVGGTDGEPDELTGRFALEGQSISDAASGLDRWIVVGDGLTQALDDDASRLSEARAALSGEAISFIEGGPSGWLIGGANGWLQLLDSQGEPTATMIQVLSNGRVDAAAHNGNAWLVGSENGDVVVVNNSLPLPSSAGSMLDSGKSVVAIVADASGAQSSPAFLAFSADSAIPVSGTGVPQTAISFQAGVQITTAEFGGNKVFVGTSDGRLGVADYGSNPSFSFTNVLAGGAVSRLVSNGADWIALGANGQAQRFDNNGMTLGNSVQITSDTGRPVVGAHWTGTQWRLVVGAIGFVAFVDDQLNPPRTLVPVLDGARINSASSGGGRVLVVGEGGAFQVLDDRGLSVSATGSVGTNLSGAEWNGDNWLIVGDRGFAQLIDPSGSLVGASVSLLGGNDIRFASWSGEFFLVGGVGGDLQVVRADGTASGGVFSLTGATDLHAARWSGRDWLVVGEAPGTVDPVGAFAVIIPTDSGTVTPTLIDTTGPLRAVDFNGIEFLVAGDRGLIQRVSAQGMTVDSPSDVLTGFGIRDIYFNGVNYIVAGEFGSLRRLGQDYLPLRTPLAVLDREDAAAVVWTAARGFASGPCLTNELCYEGPCVGGLTSGRCCDSACDRACESCFQNDTGEQDGTCAPVAVGKQPPVKEGSAGCQRQSESTCGLTGSCDGAGECESYGAEVQCAEAVCSLGKYTAIAECNGMGACGGVAEQDCAPYAGCNIDGCVEVCNADQDCLDGFVCDGDSCVAETDTTAPPAADEPEDKGCCATVPTSHGAELWLLLVGFALVLRRRA